MNREVYLDNSATTRPYDAVIEYMSDINRNIYANPSSLHTKGLEAEKLLVKARKTVAESLGVDSREIYFTSGGTESNNIAILGYLEANPRKGRRIITTKIEHPSVLEVFRHLSNRGYAVDYLDVDKKGFVDLDRLKSSINDQTALISVILVNNETGSLQPIEEITRLRDSINKNAAIHADAAQAYGKMDIFPRKQGIDLLTISSHKIHGPKGVGALYVNNKLKIKPIIFGGGQESLIRSGTENVPGIAGFGLAAEMTFAKMRQNNEKVQRLKDMFIEKLKASIDDYTVVSPENASPYILNISFGAVKAEVLLHHLETMNIFVSTGSACSSKKKLHSHVLKAMGFSERELEGAIRFSFSPLNSEEDIIYAIDALAHALAAIRRRK